MSLYYYSSISTCSLPLHAPHQALPQTYSVFTIDEKQQTTEQVKFVLHLMCTETPL